MTEPRNADCHRAEEAVAWALHALEPDEELQYRDHLAGCADCQEAVRDAAEVLAGLGASSEQVDPPPQLRDSLLARAAETPQVPPPPPPRPAADPDPEPAPPAPPRRTDPARPVRGGGFPPRGRRLLAAVALVAVVAVGGLAIRNVQLQQQRDAETAQAQGVTELLDELARPGTRHALLSTDDGTTVAAVVVADDHHEVFTVGMPPNAADSTTYVLWGIAAGADPRPLGTFDVTGADTGPRTLGPGAEAEFSAYAISLEQGRAAPAAPSAVMASGQVAT